MSDWTARIQNHRIWALLENLGPSIDKALKLDSIDPAAVDALERLRVVLAFCGKRLGGTDPAIVPPATLENLAPTFESLKSEVDAFAADQNIERLARANVQADLALTQIAQVPALSTPQDLIGLIQVITSHRAELEQMMHAASEARVRLNAELEGLKNNFETFRTNSQAGIAETAAAIEAEKQKLATLATQQQKLFSDAQESRANTHNETLLKYRKA